MSRPLRIEFPGAVYHVMSRGNGRQDIVHNDADRQRLVDGLEASLWREAIDAVATGFANVEDIDTAIAYGAKVDMYFTTDTSPVRANRNG